jgi:hypothetical protein
MSITNYSFALADNLRDIIPQQSVNIADFGFASNVERQTLNGILFIEIRNSQSAILPIPPLALSGFRVTI